MYLFQAYNIVSKSKGLIISWFSCYISTNMYVNDSWLNANLDNKKKYVDVEVLLLMFDQEKFFGMGQQCTTHQIENYLRPTPTLLFHMSSHKKADHTKGDDKWAGAKVILSLNYGLWPFSSAYFHTDVPKREISTHSFQFIRIQGVCKKNVLSVHFWILIHFMPLF